MYFLVDPRFEPWNLSPQPLDVHRPEFIAFAKFYLTHQAWPDVLRPQQRIAPLNLHQLKPCMVSWGALENPENIFVFAIDRTTILGNPFCFEPREVNRPHACSAFAQLWHLVWSKHTIDPGEIHTVARQNDLLEGTQVS